jgi:hypothetical protein
MQWHNLRGICGNGVNRGSALNEQTSGCGLTEIAGEVERGETVVGMSVDGMSIDGVSIG